MPPRTDLMNTAIANPVKRRQVCFPLNAKPLSDDAVTDLAVLKGRCGRAGGVTDDMMRSMGSTIKELTGVHVALVWDFYDRWGFGGNSEWAVVTKTGQLREMPEGWFDFLWDGDEETDIRELFARPAGKVIPRWQRLESLDDHNYVRKNSPSEELG